MQGGAASRPWRWPADRSERACAPPRRPALPLSRSMEGRAPRILSQVKALMSGCPYAQPDISSGEGPSIGARVSQPLGYTASQRLLSRFDCTGSISRNPARSITTEYSRNYVSQPSDEIGVFIVSSETDDAGTRRSASAPAFRRNDLKSYGVLS